MARYNTSFPNTSTTTTATLATPGAGLFTKFTGTSYTVTIPDPILYQGMTQTFYNAASGTITLSTPSGVFVGPGSSGAVTQPVPTGTTISLASDGTNYVVVSEDGGPLVATTGAFSENVTMSGTQVRSSSSQVINNSYDLISLTYLQTNYGKPWTVVTSTTTAVAGDRLMCNTTSSSFTINLPASPAAGDTVHIIDYNGTFNTQSLTINNNGNRIMRVNDTMTVSTAGAAFQLVFSGAANPGWLVAQGI